MTEMTLIQAINEALKEEMSRDETITVMGEDVGVDGGVFRATQGLVDEFGEKRVMDTPISEAGIVGMGVGMAINGLKPVIEIQFSGFIYPAFQEIISHVSRIRNRSRGRFTCPMVIRSPYGGGINALEHHSESMEAMYAHIPGLKVVIPSTPADAKGLLTAAIRDPDPVLFLEPKRVYRAFKDEVPEGEHVEEIGKAKVVQEGTQVTVVSWGAMMHTTLEAIKELTRKGVSCEVIDLRTIMPWDVETVVESVKKTGRLVVVHEATRTAGFAAEIFATVNEEALMYMQAPMKRVTGYDIIMPYLKYEKLQLPSVDRVIAGIKEVVDFES
ncbi:MAG: alpha-ketoacid dehydrogenase subunit beta [Candidatus Woesearchaeota archaeon]